MSAERPASAEPQIDSANASACDKNPNDVTLNMKMGLSNEILKLSVSK